MTGLIRKATLMTLLGLLVAQAAMAGVPSASTSVLPPSGAMRLGVYSTAPPGPGGRSEAGAGNNVFTFSVTVNDGGGFPVQFTPVTIDFNACHDLWLAAVQPYAGVTIDCLTHRVFASTNNLGVASFNIIGSSENPNGSELPSVTSAAAAKCAQVSCSSQTLGFLEVVTIDMDNQAGVGAADIGAEVQDVLFSQNNPPQFFGRADSELDFDNDAADIGLFVDIFINVLTVSGTNGGSCGDPLGSCCSLLN